jgi:light-regulated signal transduction histidine kinase (bacteriophytochrome)
MLKDELGGGITEKGRHYMEVINASATHMGQLIDDLLSFSRMGRGQMAVQAIDMEFLIREIIKTFAKEIGERGVKVEISHLDPIEGDMAMIRVVMMNLISNAIKFTSKTPEPLIKIGSELNENETVYHVSDNGAGFDMKYANKLFGVFQRLHGEADFEGTGIGLATVKRVIDRHGGRIWADGSPGSGASFFFSLPRKHDIVTEKEISGGMS